MNEMTEMYRGKPTTTRFGKVPAAPSSAKAGGLPSSVDLLAELSRLYKIQPATALWRAVEIREVLAAGLPAGTGLDLGCGDGGLAGVILRHLDATPELIGLDLSDGEIAVARRRGIYGQAICSSGDRIPLADASIDFVFSNSVLEHIPPLEETFAEIFRVLRPGGTVIATVPSPTFRELLHAGGKTGAARQTYLDRMDNRLAHHHYLDAAGWSALCARHGLELTLAKPYLNRAQVQRWERLSAMTGGVLQTLGASNAMLYRLQRLTRSDDRTAGGLLKADSEPAGWSRLWAKVVAGSVLHDRVDPAGAHACLLLHAIKPAAPKAAQQHVATPD